MIKLFRSKEPFKQFSGSNVAIASKEVTEPTDSVKETIAAIHNEFHSAGDKLLAEAKAIIEQTGQNVLDKTRRLRNIGFSSSSEVTLHEKSNDKLELAKVVQEFKSKYPLNKFITDEQVREINRKYNLVCGPINRYKGFVPEAKLKLMEKFNSTVASNYRHSNGFSICAPQSDMNTEGLVKNGTMYSVPDPVVLFPVLQGYLIVAAWGEEASDPIIVNEIGN